MSVVCLPNPHRKDKLDLATIGANARRATEDSTAIAFLEVPDPSASRFTRPILETAEIPWIADASGATAMAQLMKLLSETDAGSLRTSLQDKLNEP